MNVNSKQILAVISAVALVVVLVYPALATGGVAIRVGSSAIEKAEHVYATIGVVWVHRSGQSDAEGWQVVLNQSRSIDLVPLASALMDLGTGQIPLGSYDRIRVEISNVTWVFNETTTKLQLQASEVQSSFEFTAQAGRDVVGILTLAGYQQEIGGVNFFVPTLTSTRG